MLQMSNTAYGKKGNAGRCTSISTLSDRELRGPERAAKASGKDIDGVVERNRPTLLLSISSAWMAFSRGPRPTTRPVRSYTFTVLRYTFLPSKKTHPIDPQPGTIIHLYFLLLSQAASKGGRAKLCGRLFIYMLCAVRGYTYINCVQCTVYRILRLNTLAATNPLSLWRYEVRRCQPKQHGST